jgi:hypothetical protein
MLMIFISCVEKNHSNSIKSYPNKENSKPSEDNCNQKQYSNLLFDLAINFKPTNLNFDKSVINDEKLNAFLQNVDYECLKKQDKFEFFICIILLKQYKYHIANFHQGYDLLSMNSNNAKVIIDNFILFSRLNNTNLEMLNSRYVVDYVEANNILRNNNEIKNIVIEILKIEKGLIK